MLLKDVVVMCIEDISVNVATSTHRELKKRYCPHNTVAIDATYTTAFIVAATGSNEPPWISVTHTQRSISKRGSCHLT